MNTAEVLERAAEVIVERGWWRGPWARARKGSAQCAWTALHGVAPNAELKWAAGDLLAVHLGYEGYFAVGFVTRWNDDPSRTADEVVAALRDCAAAERAKATP